MILPNLKELRPHETYRWVLNVNTTPKYGNLWISEFTFPADDCESASIGQCEVIFVAPADLDPRSLALATLRAEEQKLRADFQKSLTEIQARIQKCLAIENGA